MAVSPTNHSYRTALSWYAQQQEVAATQTQKAAALNEELAAKAEEAANEQKAIEDELREQEEPQWSAEAEELLDQIRQFQEASKDSANQFKPNTSSMTDDSSKLAQALANSACMFSVRNVMSDINKSLVQFQMAAATSTGKEAQSARAVVRRLEKLLGRGSKKLRELDSEDVLRSQRKRAQQQKQEKRVQEIKRELEHRERQRMQRDQAMVQSMLKPSSWNQMRHDANQNVPGSGTSDAAIQAQAEAIAAAEAVASGEMAGVGGDISVGGEGGFEGGGEVAVEGGGGGDAGGGGEVAVASGGE